ncbi:class I SAM-dependent methyltransferase [Sphingomonas immobilis]|uniref:Methyltransferase n=1 Tax=Sphingomonas immobilis TaxID=3063997 RepID=A0ABT8ZUT0_9SPHN|nr:methyltransferase [Sphingomonas sp. CA1-15]MDO7841328.1 methyltransferase [Sphingomonas sp. CA1-15]
MPSSTSAVRAPFQTPYAQPSQGWAFLQGFLRNPVMVGAVTQSSRRLVARMLAPIDWSATKLIVEYGPGVGTFTQTILDKLPEGATLIAIDTNYDFVRHLRRTIQDRRFLAVCGSAADVRAIIGRQGFEKADYVVSGLPFSTLPPGVGDTITAATHSVLRKGGGFLAYNYTTRVGDCMKRAFTRIDHAMEWWNVPPAQLYWAWKD